MVKRILSTGLALCVIATMAICQVAYGGSGFFIDSGQSLGSSASNDVTLGDLDGDGDLDAFVVNDWHQANQVWLNNGNGVFTDSGQSLGAPSSGAVALGDLDGDGDLDAFVANVAAQANEVRLNNGNGVFTDSGQTLGSSHSAGVALGDLDGDGDLDAFVANTQSGANQVWLNNGIGIFTDNGQDLGYSDSMDVALGDLDGDGDLDAFVVNNNLQANTVWLNDGNGVFTDSGQNLGDSYSIGVALGDVDGDGDLDAFVANTVYQANKVWLNDGTAIFVDSGQTLGSSDSHGVALRDVDADGDLDAFVGNSAHDSSHPKANKVWLNDGAGVFTDSGQNLGASTSRNVALGDLDGDGDLDAFVANDNDHANKVYYYEAYGVVLWNKLESESAGVVASEIGHDGIRLSWPNDSNASTFTYAPGYFGNGIQRTQIGYVGTPNEFLSFGVDETNHTGINIVRGCIEFWWKAVDFGDDVAGSWFISSKSSSERADDGGSGNWPIVNLSFNSWDYGQGNRHSVQGYVQIKGRSDYLGCRLKEDYQGGDFVPGTWYHLALVWDVDGIPGDPDGHKIAIYRDGVKWSQYIERDDLNVDTSPYVPTFWFPGTRPTDYAGGGACYYNLWGTYDNIKAWNYAKTDFSDRFSESPLDTDGDGIHNDVDEDPLTVSDRFSDVALGGVTSGRILGLDTEITVQVMDAVDPSKGVRVLVSGPAEGEARIKIDGSKGTYKLAPGEYILTSGSVTLEVLEGNAEVEFIIGGATVIVSVQGTAIFEEVIVDEELQQLTVYAVAGYVAVNDEVVTPGFDLTTMSVWIDIKPGSDPNCFNSDGHGVIPVAILSSEDFDATQVDPTTVSLDAQGVRVVGKGNTQAHDEDVNGDGLEDLVVQIEDIDGTYEEGDTIGTLTGETFGGTSIVGTDTICIVP